MIYILNGRCSIDTRTKVPSFNDLGNKSAMYCKQHAEDGMVNVWGKRCFHASCTKRPNFNILGCETAVYCKQHADDGMVDVRNQRRSHEPSRRRTLVSVANIKTPLYPKQHADNSKVNVRNRRCSHHFCTLLPVLGTHADRSEFLCSRHINSVTAGLVGDFNRKCEAEGCRLWATWGFTATQPTHCPDHGRIRHDLSCTAEADREGGVWSCSPFDAEQRLSCQIKPSF